MSRIHCTNGGFCTDHLLPYIGISFGIDHDGETVPEQDTLHKERSVGYQQKNMYAQGILKETFIYQGFVCKMLCLNKGV